MRWFNQQGNVIMRCAEMRWTGPSLAVLLRRLLRRCLILVKKVASHMSGVGFSPTAQHLRQVSSTVSQLLRV